MTGLPLPSIAFIQLWGIAANWTEADRLSAAKPNPSIDADIRKLLSSGSPETIFEKYGDLLNQRDGYTPYERGKIMRIMELIDEFFLRVHPRAVTAAPGIIAGPAVPDWLKDLRDNRTRSGEYARLGERRLIPRGPLTRSCRNSEPASAEALADRFSALSIVPTTYLHNDRPIKVRHLTSALAALSGAGRAKRNGTESVVVIPLAEESGDLRLEQSKIHETDYFSTHLSPSIDPARDIPLALSKAGASDIALIPETTLSEDASEKLSDALSAMGGAKVGLLLAGTGNSNKKSEGKAWNMTRIVNGFGRLLWTQEKIWLAGLEPERARQYGLSPSGNSTIHELNASSSEIAVCDVDGFGRCVALICQDIKLPFLGNFISDFQPDWILTPILDPEIYEGNWIHQAFWEKCELSHARFVAATSTSLQRKPGAAGPMACLLAHGPKRKVDVDEGRLVIIASVEGTGYPDFAKITWRSGPWKKSTIFAS